MQTYLIINYSADFLREMQSASLAIMIGENLPGLGRHEAVRRLSARLGEAAHFRPADELKVIGALSVKEGHALRALVVGGDAERQNLQILEARRHSENLQMRGAVAIGKRWHRSLSLARALSCLLTLAPCVGS